MGDTGTVLRFERDGAKADSIVDTGGSNSRTAEHFEGAGDDSQPLAGDAAALQPGAGTGDKQALGYSDPVEGNKVAEPGEKRMYSRNPTTGSAVAAVYCKADGTIMIESLNGADIMVRSTGRVTVDSPDLRLGKGGRKIACVGDFVSGAVRGVTIVAGAPIPLIPIPPTPPTATAGVPFVGQIISGVEGVEGGTGDGSGE
jgi:hypothetical protein